MVIVGKSLLYKINKTLQCMMLGNAMHNIYFIFTTFRVLNMINQFTEGLNSCGNLWDIVKINWIDFLPMFTKTNERLSRASFRALFEISWSAEGSKRREDEEETIYYWELVLKMIEGERHLFMIPLMFFLVIYLESEHSQHTRARSISESRK